MDMERTRADEARYQNQRILVGMSGGLDSTYAALYLKRCGATIAGAVLSMGEETDLLGAETAARQLDIPLHIIDARDAFEAHVKSYFASSYAKGETPNPCVECNRHVKVALLCDFAQEHGFDLVCTGHYAHVAYDDGAGRYYVMRAEDEKKDQSYVLWQLTQKQLAMLITPLSYMKKTEIRKEAAAAGLSAAAAKESQDICFLPNGDYAAFVKARLGDFPEGDFVDENGCVVGRHKGIIHYTVGQRKGLGIALGKPVFVTRIDAETNTVHLAASGGEFGMECVASDIHFQKLSDGETLDGMRVRVKVRYAAPPADATVYKIQTTDGRCGVRVVFDTPQRAVTPGQSAVFYDADEGRALLFGARII